MAYTNRMGELLNKCERNLGTKPLNLPDELKKENWVEIIIDESLTKFSRMFPFLIDYKIDLSTTPNKDGWYILDEEKIPGYYFLYVKDIDWSTLSRDNSIYLQQTGYGYNDFYSTQSGISMEDICMVQMGADMNGLFNNGFFIETQSDTMFKITNALNYNTTWIRRCTLKLAVRHSETLHTISAGMMSIFEQLCCSDVATYLYNELKFYDGTESGYGTSNLRLERIEYWMDKQDEIIEKLQEASVSASNEACPIMMTI